MAKKLSIRKLQKLQKDTAEIREIISDHTLDTRPPDEQVDLSTLGAYLDVSIGMLQQVEKFVVTDGHDLGLI